jgi:hypothetical protein
MYCILRWYQSHVWHILMQAYSSHCAYPCIYLFSLLHIFVKICIFRLCHPHIWQILTPTYTPHACISLHTHVYFDCVTLTCRMFFHLQYIRTSRLHILNIHVYLDGKFSHVTYLLSPYTLLLRFLGYTRIFRRYNCHVKHIFVSTHSPHCCTAWAECHTMY